jgi:hypothetical protein
MPRNLVHSCAFRNAGHGPEGERHGQAKCLHSLMLDFADWAEMSIVASCVHVQEQQRRAGNQTHAKLDIDVAVALAHVNSIVYCEPPNIQAWNCSRCDPVGLPLGVLINC